jgi:hypothetical protein
MNLPYVCLTEITAAMYLKGGHISQGTPFVCDHFAFPVARVVGSVLRAVLCRAGGIYCCPMALFRSFYRSSKVL